MQDASNGNHDLQETPPADSHKRNATTDSPKSGKLTSLYSESSALHMTQTCNVEWAEQVSTGTPRWNSAFASSVPKIDAAKITTSNQSSSGLATQPLNISCPSPDKSFEAEKADVEDELDALYSVFPNDTSPQNYVLEANIKYKGAINSSKHQELAVGARHRRRKKKNYKKKNIEAGLIWRKTAVRNTDSRKRTKRLSGALFEGEEKRIKYADQEDENSSKVCFQDLVHEMNEGNYKSRNSSQQIRSMKFAPEAQKQFSTSFKSEKPSVSKATKLIEGNKQDEQDPLSEIDFNDEMIASLDATVDRSLNEKNVISQTDPSKYFLERAGTIPTSNATCAIVGRSDLLGFEDESGKGGNSFQKYKDQTHRQIDDDEFGECPWIDFDEMDRLVAQSQGPNCTSGEADVIDKMHPLRRNSPNGPERISFTRYRVVSASADIKSNVKVLDVVVWMHQDRQKTTFQCEDSADSVARIVDGQILLHDEWIHSCVEVGDTIHICSISGRYRSDVESLPIHLNSNGSDDLVMVLHPDLLVTPTAISDTVICPRRAILKMRMGSNRINASALLGQLRHDLFEICLAENNCRRNFIHKQVPIIVRNRAENLVGCGALNEEDMINEVLKIIPQIQKFAAAYTSFGLGRENIFNKGSQLDGQGIIPNIEFLAQTVFDTEEETVSTELGLKGFIDVTVETISSRYNRSEDGLEDQKKDVIIKSLMPIELKTGHNQNPQGSHMAQLALYTLTLRSRHGSALMDDNDKMSAKSDHSNFVGMNGAANGGMLLYLNNESIKAIHVCPSIAEAKTLISQRNSIASDIKTVSKPRGVVLSYEDGSIKKKLGRNSRTPHQILPAPAAQLPDLMQSSASCERCYMNRECMLNASANSAELSIFGAKNSHKKLLDHFTDHLSNTEMQYFRDWDRLIDLEACAVDNDITKSWLVDSVTREKKTGTCMSLLTLNQPELDIALSQSNNVGHTSLVMRFDRGESLAIMTPLNVLRFDIGCRVALSTDCSSLHSLDVNHDQSRSSQSGHLKDNSIMRKQLNILRGSVEAIEEKKVFIRTNRNDTKRLNRIIQRTKWTKQSPQGEKLPDHTYFRLDKIEYSAGVTTLRQNLVNLFTADTGPFRSDDTMNESSSTEADRSLKHRLKWLRRSIIHLEPAPEFDLNIAKPLFVNNHIGGKLHPVSGCDLKILSEEFDRLNGDQKVAVLKVLSARDYSLIQGFPGTGKTSTIAFITRLLAARGNRVLITSYTHAAVDNLLIKLMNSGVGRATDININMDLVRIGPKSSCHEDLHQYLVPKIASDLDSIGRGSCQSFKNDDVRPSARSLSDVISSAKIVGVSALTIPKTPLLSGQHFDYVICDEAGQISQPAMIGALMAADSFVLVGDHEQLPPLVQSNLAEEAGYGVSTFKRLADKHPFAVAQLTLQYRMNEDICFLSNEIIYNGSLKCANEAIKSTKLCLPHFPKALKAMRISTKTVGFGWLVPVLNPKKSVVFACTDASGVINGVFKGLEVVQTGIDGGSIINETEAIVTQKILHGLSLCGLDYSSIAIICPYKSQLKLLHDHPLLISAKNEGLELSTIDKFQGRDKDAVIVSFVRSNQNGRCGRLLADYRRLNVALSRARKKLIMIGSTQTLAIGNSVLAPLLDRMKEKRWIEALPENVTDVYI